MDLRAPNGTDLGASLYWPLSKALPNSQLRFHAGSHAIFPALLVYAYCPTNEIVVDGGSTDGTLEEVKRNSEKSELERALHLLSLDLLFFARTHIVDKSELLAFLDSQS